MFLQKVTVELEEALRALGNDEMGLVKDILLELKGAIDLELHSQICDKCKKWFSATNGDRLNETWYCLDCISTNPDLMDLYLLNVVNEYGIHNAVLTPQQLQERGFELVYTSEPALDFDNETHIKNWDRIWRRKYAKDIVWVVNSDYSVSYFVRKFGS